MRTIPEGTQRPRESADISVKPRVRPCYNDYATFLKALLLCSACNDRDVVSRYYVVRLDTVLEAEKESWRQC